MIKNRTNVEQEVIMSKKSCIDDDFGSPEEITYEGVAEFSQIYDGSSRTTWNSDYIWPLPTNRWNAAQDNQKKRSWLGCFHSWRTSVSLLANKFSDLFIIDAVKRWNDGIEKSVCVWYKNLLFILFGHGLWKFLESDQIGSQNYQGLVPRTFYWSERTKNEPRLA